MNKLLKRVGYSKKAQVSMEYLAVIGISLFLIMPMVVIYFQQSTSLSDDIHSAQIHKIAQELIDASEEVYYLGAPSTKQLLIHLPQGIEAITLIDDTIFVDYRTGQGALTLSAYSNLALNLTGTIPINKGTHRLNVRARTNDIQISEAT